MMIGPFHYIELKLDSGYISRCDYLSIMNLNMSNSFCYRMRYLLFYICFNNFPFVAIQIEKIVLFLLEQQGILASRIEKLVEQHDALQQEPEINKINGLREAYRTVGQDLLKLLYFVEINAVGLRKILKKFDKRFGYRFTDYYVKTRANHPYSQLQQVFKHVVICLFQMNFHGYIILIVMNQIS